MLDLGVRESGVTALEQRNDRGIPGEVDQLLMRLQRVTACWRDRKQTKNNNRYEGAERFSFLMPLVASHYAN